MTMMSVTFEVMFRVEAEVESGEVVCVVGDCDRLGNWDPHHAVVLSRESSSPGQCRKNNQQMENSDVWRKKVKLCGMKNYNYRYFVCQIIESDSESTERTVKVIRWETNILPRVFSPADYMKDPGKYDAEIMKFGEYGGKNHVTKGWLTDQSEIHIRIHGNPIRMWKPKYRKQTYRIKCTPLDQRYKDTLDERQINHCVQSESGTIFETGSYMIFTAETTEPESLGFQFDFYVNQEGVTPKHIGYCYLLPVDLKKSNDTKTVPITGLNHKPIGQIDLDYLTVKPVPGLDLKMDVSYQNYWKFERKSLDVGHRGMGSSYKHKKLAAVRENTVQSLQDAANHGADYVEFDVQLSRDMIPVIYHDFHVAITYRKKKREELEFYQASVKDLKLSELQSMKLAHASRISDNDRDDIHEDDIDPTDLQPFPALERVFEAVNPATGFNVEIKYPQEKVRKQNKYPTLLLTNGEDVEKYVPYMDLRTRSIDMAIYFATFSNLLGIDVLTSTLFRNMNKIEKVKEAKLVLFCWGEDNNDSNAINTLKQKGVDGIIYDRIDFFKSGDKSVFQVEQEQTERILMSAGLLSPTDTLQNLEPSSGLENENGTTILHVAVSSNNPEIVKLLLSAKADVQKANNQGRTPLHLASRSGNAEITKQLIDAGSDVNATTNKQYTALHEALRNGHIGLSKYLIHEGADVNMEAKSEGILDFLLKSQHLDPPVFTDMMDFCLLHGYKISRDLMTRKVQSVKALQNCEQIQRWLQKEYETVPLLSNICRNLIRQQLTIRKKSRLKKSIENLPLPFLLKDFLAFQDEECESLLKLTF
uniref:Putative glycerophosphodiester phosphodiesterase 5 n=1 Tax=Magallana gigas TaxID=29159 RepID=K1R2E2_MAGGI